MILDRLGLIKNQHGFTLLELLVALAITGIITGGITMTIFQVFNVNARSSDHMVAVRQVQNAGYWISHDAQMAQGVVIGDDPETEFLILTYTDWDNTKHEITYSLVNGQLNRTENGETTMVAKFIDSTKTNCRPSDSDSFILTVTAKLGEESETRIYEILPRPSIMR